ncbi:MAG TPA: hypothetical protein VIL01_03715 [Thermomicrobiales bacterium]
MYLAVGGRTDLSLTLVQPVTLSASRRPTPPVCAVHIAVDDPHRLADTLRDRAFSLAAAVS